MFGTQTVIQAVFHEDSPLSPKPTSLLSILQSRSKYTQDAPTPLPQIPPHPDSETQKEDAQTQ